MPIEVRGRGRVGVGSGLRRHQEIESRFRENNPPPGAGGVVIEFGGVVIRIRILMYPACILKDTRIMMYLKRILHAHCYIRREYMYLDILHVL
jgi:hypothetical protein